MPSTSRRFPSVPLVFLLGLAPLARGETVPLGGEFQVNTATVYGQGSPRVGMDGDDDFVVAWTRLADGDHTDVSAQRFAELATLDIDGNGTAGALTDGLLALRYLFGFRGAVLITGAVDLVGCTRCDATAIEAYLTGLD